MKTQARKALLEATPVCAAVGAADELLGKVRELSEQSTAQLAENIQKLKAERESLPQQAIASGMQFLARAEELYAGYAKRGAQLLAGQSEQQQSEQQQPTAQPAAGPESADPLGEAGLAELLAEPVDPVADLGLDSSVTDAPTTRKPTILTPIPVPTSEPVVKPKPVRKSASPRKSAKKAAPESPSAPN